MDIPAPPQSVVALVAFVRDRLAGAVVGAAAPFAPTSYSRARLIRQMHASGLLTDDEVRRTAIAPGGDDGGARDTARAPRRR